MKFKIFTFLVIFALGFSSCRKDKNELTIKQYDQSQIQNYIAVHGLTGFLRDTTGGDTTGMYYKIVNPGVQTDSLGRAVTPVDYPDKIYFVYTVVTFDGNYSSTDTIANHFYDYVGHISTDKYPLGLQTAVHNLLKYPGATMRLLIPSHLAYGIDGSGSGSSQVANNKIGGNECLDYYVHSIYLPKVNVYDDLVIRNYMRDSSLTNYTKTASGLYYKILTPSTSTDPITALSTITETDTGQLFNATIFDQQFNGTNLGTFPVIGLVPGVEEGLINYARNGTKISMLLPSALGYGSAISTSVPAFSCLRFTFIIDSVTP